MRHLRGQLSSNGRYPVPMPSIRPLLAPLLACILPFALAACVSTPPPASPASAAVRTPLVLVSIDGFRADYLDAGLAPNLSAIAGEGVRAQWMNPSYPSLTFPNHYSIVTGLRPDHHGIVHNTMRDAELGGFKLSDRDAVGDGRWWGGEPIWITAQKAGLRSATMYWPGSQRTEELRGGKEGGRQVGFWGWAGH